MICGNPLPLQILKVRINIDQMDMRVSIGLTKKAEPLWER